MQRDVKVGLVLGGLLVAVVAIVFFRRDDEDRDKFTKLLPAPDAVAAKARDALGPSPSEPYPVAPEHFADSWQTQPAAKPARTTPQTRNMPPEGNANPDSSEEGTAGAKKSAGGPVAVLQKPEFGPTKPSARNDRDASASSLKSSGTDSPVRSNGTNEYTIQEGDTLIAIASRFLEHSSQWPLLCEANPDVLADPDHLQVGQRIRIPATRKTAKPAPAPAIASAACTARQAPPVRDRSFDSYEVQEGDTLIQIAREKYGRDAMYLDILNANRDQLPNPGDLRPGMWLKLPK